MIQGFRALIIVCLAVLAVGSSERVVSWRVASLIPAVLALIGTLALERRTPLPRALGWAWVGVFDLVVLGLVVVTFGEAIDITFLAFLFLGLVIATARNQQAGMLVGAMAAAGYTYLALQHTGSRPSDGSLWSMVFLFLVIGLLSGMLSQEADLRSEAYAAETAELRQELADLGEHLKNVLSCVGSGVLVIDGDHRITTFNRAAQRILGVKEHLVLGREAESVAHLRTLVPVLGENPLTESGEGEPGGPRPDLEFSRPDGTTVRIGYALTPLENVAGRRLGTILVFQDVTLIRDYEVRMLRQEQLAALGRMVSGIAHEFGNILGGARGLLDLASQEEPPEAVKTLPVVRETLARALETVDHLLKFARGTPLNPIPGVELGAVLDRALHLLKADLEKNDVLVEKAGWEGVPALVADAVQLERVFINIIINAIHALQACEERRLRISLSSNGAYASVRFEDTGPGIPQASRERIFEPFFTTKGSLGGSEIPGTGLGLSVALGVIEGHRGSLEVATSPDLKGACFTITLPSTTGEPSGDT